jgi:hypothetical protein
MVKPYPLFAEISRAGQSQAFYYVLIAQRQSPDYAKKNPLHLTGIFFLLNQSDV